MKFTSLNIKNRMCKNNEFNIDWLSTVILSCHLQVNISMLLAQFCERLKVYTVYLYYSLMTKLVLFC